ncbi:MAG: BMP family ABC transporter substrate-binding protein [Clostridia bacterium]|nr:BMP family ABC transporter substrate-binding protein [Clostridia bacterium]
MKKTFAIMIALVLVLAMVGCTAEQAAQVQQAAEQVANDPAVQEAVNEAAAAIEAAAGEAPAADAFKIGVILVHDENSGYDLAHIEGMQAAQATLGLTDDQIIYKYNIEETEMCYDTAVDLAEQGCNIIFSDSYGHQSHMMQAAAEYPDVFFVACTGDTAALQANKNVANMFPFTFESRYVSGVVAGMKLKELMDAGTVTDPYIGYVGAFPYAEVVSGYTAFFLGIRSIVPEAHMDVQFTNSWYDPIAEAEAANALISKGCVIIGQHADSTGAPSAVQAAQDAGKVVYSVGYNVSMLAVAPTAALTSAQNNWGALYTPMIDMYMKGETLPTDLAKGYADGGVMISELGASCAPGTAEKVAEVEAALKDGSLNVFDCSTFTVAGEAVTTYLGLDTDGDWVNDTGEAIADGVFEESVLRSAPYFAMDIDGITKLN